MLKFAILSINVDHLVDGVLVGSMKILSVMGRSFTEMLADTQGDTMTDMSAYEKYLEVHGLLADIKNAECEAKGEIRSHFLAAHNLWYSTVQHYQAKIQQCDRSLHDRL